MSAVPKGKEYLCRLSQGTAMCWLVPETAAVSPLRPSQTLSVRAGSLSPPSRQEMTNFSFDRGGKGEEDASGGKGAG